jgi:hypothetical protein
VLFRSHPHTHSHAPHPHPHTHPHPHPHTHTHTHTHNHPHPNTKPHTHTQTHARALAKREIGNYVSLSLQVKGIEWRKVKHTVLFVHSASFIMDSGVCLLRAVAVVVKQTATALHCRRVWKKGAIPALPFSNPSLLCDA